MPNTPNIDRAMEQLQRENFKKREPVPWSNGNAIIIPLTTPLGDAAIIICSPDTDEIEYYEVMPFNARQRRDAERLL